MQDELVNLKDIASLDYISAIWPLAIGWWIIICLILIMLFVGIMLIVKQTKHRHSWEYKKLANLEEYNSKLSEETKLEVCKKISEELRIIAMYKSSRSKCARLFGSAWLNFLEELYPDARWSNYKYIIIDAPYVANDTANKAIELSKVRELIVTTKQWVKR